MRTSLIGFAAALTLASFPLGGQQPATLQVTAPVISQFEDGPALGGQSVVPGETVFFRFDVTNFKTSESGAIKITGHSQGFDSRGTAIAARDELVIGTTLREEDKNWKPRLRSQFQIPSIAPPGTYRIKFDATDDQSHQSASGETTLVVQGIDVAPSATLVIRSLNFYRRAEDETPLKTAAYRAGDMVWVHFDVTGYKYGEQNAIDVSYDVAVTTAEGKQLFTQENAAVEKSQAFYPQPWVPGSFSLTLQSTMHAGLYAIAITARDAVGAQTGSATAQFRVD